MMPPRADLDHLRALQPGWDGYEGLPPTAQALTRAELLLARLAGTPLAGPSCVPNPDGGLQLEWAVSSLYIELGIGPTGAFVDLDFRRDWAEENDSATLNIEFISLVRTLTGWLGRTLTP